MKAILDFNGYYREKRFLIKEYSLYVIHDQTYNVVSHDFQISKPPNTWNILSLKNSNNYKTYFETFGISWKKGTHDGNLIANTIWDTLKTVEVVYVINQDKRDLLENYFDKDLPFEFKYLNDLGFEFEPQMSTQCQYHKKPEKNNCANDNALAMIEWLKKVKIVIDFNGYFFSDTEYIIKEYSLYIFRDKTNEIVSKDFQVSKPPLPCHRLDKITQDNYTVFYNSYGIGWNKGTRDNEFIKSDLTQKLETSMNIYVRDQTQNKLLISYLEQDFNAICLADVGLNLEPRKTTDCEHHVQPDKNNCANDNVDRMFTWLTIRQSDDFNILDNDTNIVLDFNGYFLDEDNYMIKEYSLYAVCNKSKEIIYKGYNISKPPYLCHKLNEIVRVNYTNYYETFGIDWSKGTRDSGSIRSDLQKKLRSSRNIYVKDQRQRELLNIYFNHDFKAINLTDLGLTFEPVVGTKCTNHEQPDKNICAHDNVIKMVDFLAQIPRLPGSRTKENVVIDFNGFFVDDKYVVKEYSSYIINEETYQVIYNEVVTLGSPIIQKDNSNEKSFENYNAFLNEIGIDWNSGGPDFEQSKKSLQSHLNVANKVFVMDRSKHQLLLNYLENDLTTGFVYLSDLGFKFEPKQKTTCSKHKNPSTKNCANDNAQEMLDWLSESKFGVSLGLSQSDSTESLKKHVIVDFYGYNLPNNEYAIKELNAILVDKNSELDTDLHLISKPPFPDIQNLPMTFTDAYLEFEQRHSIGWNTGEDDFVNVSKTLSDYFETVTHIYVENLEKQKLLEKFIGKKHHFIRFKDLKFRSKPRKSTDGCQNHYSEDSICAVVFSKTMLQWFEEHVLRRLPPRQDFDEDDHEYDVVQESGTSDERTNSVENVYSNVSGRKRKVEDLYSTIDEIHQEVQDLHSTVDGIERNVEELYSKVNKRKRSIEDLPSTFDDDLDGEENIYSTIDETQQNAENSPRKVKKKVTFSDDLNIGSEASFIPSPPPPPPPPPMPTTTSAADIIPSTSQMSELTSSPKPEDSPRKKRIGFVDELTSAINRRKQKIDEELEMRKHESRS